MPNAHPLPNNHKAQSLTLLGGPLSPQAHAWVSKLLAEVIIPKACEGRKTKLGRITENKYRTACGALLADLLDLSEHATDSVSREGYHGLTKNNFNKDRLGFGYDAFMDVMAALRDVGIISVAPGDQTPARQVEGRKRLQTRFVITPLGLESASGAGLQTSNFSDHWQRYRGQTLPSGHHNIHLKETRKRRGKEKAPSVEMTFNIEDHPQASRAAQGLKRINDYLRQQTFGDIAFPGLRRIFNNGNEQDYAWNKGGRFYSIGGGHRYEAWSADKRKSVLKINGEPTAEVDLKASHLTLLYALKEQPFDASTDPYEIDGIPRVLVKAWITKSLGVSHAFHEGWPDELKADYERERPSSHLEDDFPHFWVRALAQNKHPVLLDLFEQTSIYGPLNLQFHEAEILRLSMEDLMLSKGIPVLPIHDALICPQPLQETVRDSLISNFRAYIERLTGRTCTAKPEVAIKASLGHR